MSNRRLEREDDDLELSTSPLANELLYRWKFFLPSRDLVRDVLRLNDKLGSAYFDAEFDALARAEGGGPSEEPVKDVNWFRWLFRQTSDAISHGEGDGERRGKSEEDELSFFRASISERIFNHLAMLARSRYAAQGGEFSIREELTAELAEKIGLGLYLHHKTSPDLRAEAESVLLRLAGEFQHWLVVVRGGVFGATWGLIHTSGRRVAGAGGDALTLILTPDADAKAREASGGDT